MLRFYNSSKLTRFICFYVFSGQSTLGEVGVVLVCGGGGRGASLSVKMSVFLFVSLLQSHIVRRAGRF